MNLYTIDFETQGIEDGSPNTPVPVGVSIKINGNPSHYYAWGHTIENNCTEMQATSILSDIFYDEDSQIICHNAKFDMRVAMEHFKLPYPRPSRVVDTMIMAYLLNPREKSLSLKPLTSKYCNMPPEEQDELHNWIIKNVPGSKSEPGAFIYLAPGKLVGRYAESDTDRTFILYNVFKSRIYVAPNGDHQTITDAFNREMALMPIVIDMEQRGVHIADNVDVERESLERMMILQDNITMAYSGNKKPGSLAMYQAFLDRGFVDKSKLRYTPTGRPSFKKEYIDDIISDKELSKTLVLRSRLQKLISTYVRPFSESANKYKGKFYPYYNQTRGDNDLGTRTGRFCIAQDSLVQVPGGSVSIQNIKPGQLVYSFDSNLDLCLKKVISVECTGFKKVLRIHWQVNGSNMKALGYLDCTPDHRIRLVNGNYIEAQNLNKGSTLDRVLAVRRESGVLGNRRLFSTRNRHSGIKECLIIEELLNGPLKPNELVHHLDHDKTNDDPSNLLRMKASHHYKLHGLDLTVEDEIVLLKDYNIDNDFIVNCDGELCEITIADLIEALHRCGGKSLETSRTLNIPASTLRTLCEQCNINIRQFRKQYLPDCRLITKELVEEARALCFKHNVDHAGYMFLNIGHQRFKELQIQYGFEPFISNNHIITRIEWLGIETYVYDLEVEDTHNFIANEICVHNSSNIQQLPKTKSAGKDFSGEVIVDDLPFVREFIVPAPGKILIKRDFSGQEVRVLAHYAEGRLLKAYQENPALDPHEYVHSMILDRTGRNLGRTPTKVINFLKIYGGGPANLAGLLGMSLEQAKEFFIAYDEAFPEPKQLIRDVENLARTGKLIRTWGGRSYDVEISSEGKSLYYKLVNILIQGSSADMTKEAMIRYYNHPDRFGSIFMQVHDEIVVETDAEHMHTDMAILKWAMDEIPGWDVPLMSDGAFGYSFGKMEKYDD